MVLNDENQPVDAPPTDEISVEGSQTEEDETNAPRRREHSQEYHEAEAQAERDHVNVFFTSDELPGPTTNVAKILAQTSVAEQIRQATILYDFLHDPTTDEKDLNSDLLPKVALINLPKSTLVRVIYGIGVGQSPLGVRDNDDDRFLVYTGDGDEQEPPSLLSLPETSIALLPVHLMSMKQFSKALDDKGANFRWPLLQRAKVTSQTDLPCIIPVPPFLVYDGFEEGRDLRAAEVLERVLSVEDHAQLDMFRCLKFFLRATLNGHNISDEGRPYLSPMELSVIPTQRSKTWAKERFYSIFPTLKPQHQGLSTMPPGFNINELLSQLMPAMTAIATTAVQNSTAGSTRPTATVEEEKKEDDLGGKDTVAGMAMAEANALLLMCGKEAGGDPTLFPTWVTDTSAKALSESYKLQVLHKHIMSNVYFEDAEVPVTSVLLKMVLKRQWSGKDGNMRMPSLINATEGLSPFSMLDLDVEEIAQINRADDALSSATTTSVKDITNAKSKQKATVPDSNEEFLLLLQRFANFLYAIFSGDCPLFKCILQVINALKGLSRPARLSLTKETKASILWITLLQSRQFAIGELSVLAKFAKMHERLQAKTVDIKHCDCPPSLYTPPLPPPPTKRPADRPTSNPTLKQVDQQPDPKKQR